MIYVGDIMSTSRGVWYIGGILWVYRRNSMIHVKHIISILGMFSRLEKYHDLCGGYHEYIGSVQYIVEISRLHRGIS